MPLTRNDASKECWPMRTGTRVDIAPDYTIRIVRGHKESPPGFQGPRGDSVGQVR